MDGKGRAACQRMVTASGAAHPVVRSQCNSLLAGLLPLCYQRRGHISEAELAARVRACG